MASLLYMALVGLVLSAPVFAKPIQLADKNREDSRIYIGPSNEKAPIPHFAPPAYKSLSNHESTLTSSGTGMVYTNTPQYSKPTTASNSDTSSTIESSTFIYPSINATSTTYESSIKTATHKSSYFSPEGTPCACLIYKPTTTMDHFTFLPANTYPLKPRTSAWRITRFEAYRQERFFARLYFGKCRPMERVSYC
jgi:hypothetical protein